MYILNSEYLDRNRVQTANQQYLVAQGVKFVLCNTISVYCASVECSLLKVYTMFCTKWAVHIIQSELWEFDS